MVLQAIRYNYDEQPGESRLQVLDQLQLPHRIHYNSVFTCEDGWDEIKSMRVRGAPAIAIVAALSLAVELSSPPPAIAPLPENILSYIRQRLEYLTASRPTAVNLADAARKLGAIAEDAQQRGADRSAIIRTYCDAAEKMLLDDVADNMSIGRHGAEWIMEHANDPHERRQVSVLTHCNTGSLATAGYGTALGVIRALHASESLKHAFCTETRPYNQGSRLTAFELVHDQIPATLITDSMGSALLRLKGPSENIAAVVVGADRVAANGDTANKIGTYALAIAARFHGVKFLVAAPRTTIDMHTPSGGHIKIEERAAAEMTSVTGLRIIETELDLDGPPHSISIAAGGIGIWNPAFDVTPHDLIDGIITEVGVVEKDASGQFRLDRIMEAESALNGASGDGK